MKKFEYCVLGGYQGLWIEDGSVIKFSDGANVEVNGQIARKYEFKSGLMKGKPHFSTIEVLAYLGSKGWELTGIEPTEGTHPGCMFFKREA